jgi:hypothetical protein
MRVPDPKNAFGCLTCNLICETHAVLSELPIGRLQAMGHTLAPCYESEIWLPHWCLCCIVHSLHTVHIWYSYGLFCCSELIPILLQGWQDRSRDHKGSQAFPGQVAQSLMA